MAWAPCSSGSVNPSLENGMRRGDCVRIGSLSIGAFGSLWPSQLTQYPLLAHGFHQFSSLGGKGVLHRKALPMPVDKKVVALFKMARMGQGALAAGVCGGGSAGRTLRFE